MGDIMKLIMENWRRFVLSEAKGFGAFGLMDLSREIARHGFLVNPKEDFIGEGAFGAVFIAINQDLAPHKFAIKAINKEESELVYDEFNTSVEKEIENYRFFSNLKDEDISKFD